MRIAVHGQAVTSLGNDEDGRTAALIYRDATEYATGHVCAAGWEVDAEGGGFLRSEWIPRAIVPGVSALGDQEFHSLADVNGLSPLSAAWLADCSDGDLAVGIEGINLAYERWINGQRRRLDVGGNIPARFYPIAQENLGRCVEALARMRRGAALLAFDPDARLAFRLANRACSTSGAGQRPSPWLGIPSSWRLCCLRWNQPLTRYPTIVMSWTFCGFRPVAARPKRICC